MKPSLPAIVILSTLGLGVILTLPDSISAPDKSTPHPTPANVSANVSVSFPPIDYARLHRMQHLLTHVSLPNAKEYKKLCLQATTTPQIGMTIDQARNSTWCFPYTRHTTTNIYGEMVQEVYMKNPDNIYSDRKYLYFENGTLTTIQE